MKTYVYLQNQYFQEPSREHMLSTKVENGKIPIFLLQLLQRK